VIPESVRRYAEDPAANDPNIPAGARVLEERFCIFFGPVPSVTLVGRVRLEDGEVEAGVRDVRERVAERGHRNATWSIGSSATPSDLVDELLAAGLERDDRPGSEPQLTVLALTQEPAAPVPDPSIAVRRVASYDEFLLAAEIDRTVFGLGEPGADWLERAPALYARDRAGRGARAYLGLLDGSPVATARALFAPEAVMLMGGAVLESARGHGVYRELVAARFRDAALAGTPTLVVHAGELSRPILERLGFQFVATIERLWDPATE
jgi:hypothetical protein